MREVTRQLFQDHLTLRARDEARREEVVDAAGVGRSRIERGRHRMLATVFGKVIVARIAYRGTGVADLHPADAVLNLPDGMHSHGLARLAAFESARGSFADACERINAVTGSGIGHRQVQELAVGAAADIDALYDAPGAVEEGQAEGGAVRSVRRPGRAGRRRSGGVAGSGRRSWRAR